MEAKELMIGDWVRINEGAFKVSGINNYDYWNIELDMDKNWHDEECFAEGAIEPILLTDDILELNGFEYNDNDKEWWHYDPYPFSDFQIGYDGEQKTALFNFETTNIKLNYVHELQHILRLCGLNDLADNFKIS